MIAHIKLKSGEDLVGEILDESDFWVQLKDPISVGVDPYKGFYAKGWLFLSERKLITLDKCDTYFVNIASNDAVSYYARYTNTMEDHPEVQAELLMEEASLSTKH
jgi:hypothetical protein